MSDRLQAIRVKALFSEVCLVLSSLEIFVSGLSLLEFERVVLVAEEPEFN